MAKPLEKPMSVEEFFLWQQGQEERFELVEGEPVKLMTGASTAHDRVVVNLIVALGNQLRDSPCWPATADVGVRTKIRSLRRADVIVLCDPPRADAYEARDLRLVVEVLSPSNTGIEWHRKLDEYRLHQGLRNLLLVETKTPKATLAVRGEAGWLPVDLDGLDGTIELPEIGCRLDMADIYRGVVFAEPV